jgi:hypothetical protein
MTHEQAVEIMRTSTTVEEWNSKRDEVRSKCSSEEWAKLSWKLDAMGLIVEVLGKDSEESTQKQ